MGVIVDKQTANRVYLKGYFDKVAQIDTPEGRAGVSMVLRRLNAARDNKLTSKALRAGKGVLDTGKNIVSGVRGFYEKVPAWGPSDYIDALATGTLKGIAGGGRPYNPYPSNIVSTVSSPATATPPPSPATAPEFSLMDDLAGMGAYGTIDKLTDPPPAVTTGTAGTGGATDSTRLQRLQQFLNTRDGRIAAGATTAAATAAIVAAIAARRRRKRRRD